MTTQDLNPEETPSALLRKYFYARFRLLLQSFIKHNVFLNIGLHLFSISNTYILHTILDNFKL